MISITRISLILIFVFSTISWAHGQFFEEATAPLSISTPTSATAATATPLVLPLSRSTSPSHTKPLPLSETLVYPQSGPRANYELPYSGYQFDRRSRRWGLFSSAASSKDVLELLNVIRRRAETISTFHLSYVFGGDHPSEGGLDCSGTMKFLLSDIGFSDIPRTSFDQYAWLKSAKTLHKSKVIPTKSGGRKGIKPGDLIFWGGTYASGHKVSHVMIYLGQGSDGTHYMFGARGKSKTGLNGSGVDIFKLESGHQKGLIGFGSLPGVS